MFRFNKNKQLYNVQLSVDEDTSNSIFGNSYEEIYLHLEKKFGKASIYQLKDSTEIQTVGNIYGWEGKNIKIVLRQAWTRRIVVNIYCKRFDIDKEVDDL